MADNFWDQDTPAAAPAAAKDDWWNADKPAAARDLPAGVTPSLAGAGRGSVNPPAADTQDDLPDAGPESSGAAELAAQIVGKKRSSVLEGVDIPQAPFNAQEAERLSRRDVAERTPTAYDPRASAPSMTETPAAPPAPHTSGSLTKDLLLNAQLGASKTLTGAASTMADVVGAHDTAASLDQTRQNLEAEQKENGGNTIAGKAADLVGSVAPALLVPASRAAQLVSNAALFAIPAFRDTLKSQLDQDRSFPLALAHASEAFGVNLFLPTVATRGSAAVAKALGVGGAAGAKGAAAAVGQAAGEGAAFSAANSVLDKGTDVVAGQQNDRDWLDLQDMAANALGFSVLRGAHMVPAAASAVTDRVGSPSRQFGRALGQDVDAAHFDTSTPGVQLNPNLAGTPGAPPPPAAPPAGPAPAPSPETSKPDAGDQLLNIVSATDPQRIKQLRAAGEGAVADELQRRADQQAAGDELQRMADQPFSGPAFDHFYRQLRANGVKPAEAGARAGMLGTFAQVGSQAGISADAVHAATEQALKMPLAKVPQFLDRYAAALARRGIGTALPERALSDAVSSAGDQAMHTALGAYAPPAEEAPAKPAPTDRAASQDAGAVSPDAGSVSQNPPSVPREAALDTGNDIAVTPEAGAAHQAATSPLSDLPEPTQAQKDAGNYKVGRIRIAGLDISVENPQGSVRRGVGADGKPWETPLKDHYGYIRGTVGADKDHLDVFVKPGTPEDFRGPVFVVDQVDPHTGKFDEAKVVLGAADRAEAQEVYRRNYSADWKGLGAITELPMPAFKAWAKSDHTKEPLGDLSHIKPVEPLEPQPERGAAQAPAPDRAATQEGQAPAVATGAAGEGGKPAGGADHAPAADVAGAEKPQAPAKPATPAGEEIPHTTLKRQVVDLRKRSAVLRALRECLNG